MSIHIHNHLASGAAQSQTKPTRTCAQSSQNHLMPMLAGAQARGMADMLDMQGMGAILIARDGSVLHMSARASRMIGGVIALNCGHLTGKTQALRIMLDQLMKQVLGGHPIRQIVDSESHMIEIQAYLVPKTNNPGAQLLHCVLALDAKT